MPDACSTLDLSAVISALGNAACRFDIDALAECDSTNSQLLARAEAGAPSGTVLLADRQHAGRGRRGRTWHAAPGASLTFSLLWRFPPESGAPAALSLAVGLALARAADALGQHHVQLKWPNDLLLAGRKLGGILIELQAGSLQTAVIGVGLNLDLPPELPADVAAHAASLGTGLAQPPSRERVLSESLRHLLQVLDSYAGHGFAPLRAEWQQRHAWQDQLVSISGGGKDVTGMCRGVDSDGSLLLETEQGVQRIVSGDVSLRRAMPEAQP